MVKIVRCEDCIYMYHCERTYLGCCDTGIEWNDGKGDGDADGDDEDTE